MEFTDDRNVLIEFNELSVEDNEIELKQWSVLPKKSSSDRFQW
jgi:hypothetical protein